MSGNAGVTLAGASSRAMVKRLLIGTAIVYGALAFAGVRPHDIGREMQSLSQRSAATMMGGTDTNNGYGYN